MKHTKIILSFLAFALIMMAGVGSSMAYFTTYTHARGGWPVKLGDETRITEDFSAWTKHVTIASEPGSEPVYIRVKAFCGSDYTLVYSDASGKWTPGADGYYYYSEIVAGGNATDVLDIRIENVPEDVKDPDSFRVVVIYESTPVQHHEDGTSYADWSLKADTGRTEGGEGR